VFFKLNVKIEMEGRGKEEMKIEKRKKPNKKNKKY